MYRWLAGSKAEAGGANSLYSYACISIYVLALLSPRDSAENKESDGDLRVFMANTSQREQGAMRRGMLHQSEHGNPGGPLVTCPRRSTLQRHWASPRAHWLLDPFHPSETFRSPVSSRHCHQQLLLKDLFQQQKGFGVFAFYIASDHKPTSHAVTRSSCFTHKAVSHLDIVFSSPSVTERLSLWLNVCTSLFIWKIEWNHKYSQIKSQAWNTKIWGEGAKVASEISAGSFPQSWALLIQHFWIPQKQNPKNFVGRALLALKKAREEALIKAWVSLRKLFGQSFPLTSMSRTSAGADLHTHCTHQLTHLGHSISAPHVLSDPVSWIKVSRGSLRTS